MKLNSAAFILSIIALTLAIFALVHSLNQKTVTCHWEVPLKANYEMCSNGKVIEQ